MPDTPIEAPTGARYPGNMEDRVAAIEQIARDTTAALMSIDRRLSAIDHRLDAIDHRLDGIDHRLDAMDRRMDAMDRRSDSLERRMDMFVAAQRADFRWMMGIMLVGFTGTIGGFCTMLGVMAHGFHWL